MQKTLSAPVFELPNFLIKFPFATPVTILSVLNLLVLSTQSRPFQVPSTLGCVLGYNEGFPRVSTSSTGSLSFNPYPIGCWLLNKELLSTRLLSTLNNKLLLQMLHKTC